MHGGFMGGGEGTDTNNQNSVALSIQTAQGQKTAVGNQTGMSFAVPTSNTVQPQPAGATPPPTPGAPLPATAASQPAPANKQTIGGLLAPRVRPAATTARRIAAGMSAVVNSTQDIVQHSAEKGFFPFYAKRLDEFRTMHGLGITTAKIETAIAELQKIVSGPASPITTTLNKAYAALNNIDPKLNAYAKDLVYKQFGKGLINPWHVIINGISDPNRGTGNAWDLWGSTEVNMLIETLESALFYNNIKLQQDTDDDKKFKILYVDSAGKEQELVTGAVDPKTQTIKFGISPNCPPELLDHALVAQADAIASHRQLRDNLAKLNGDGPVAIIRLAELLLCKHHMFLDLSAVQGLIDTQCPGPLKDRWEFIKAFANFYDQRDCSKLSPHVPTPEMLLILQKNGFAPEQYASRKGLRACAEWLYNHTLTDAQPYEASGYAINPPAVNHAPPSQQAMQKAAAAPSAVFTPTNSAAPSANPAAPTAALNTNPPTNTAANNNVAANNFDFRSCPIIKVPEDNDCPTHAYVAGLRANGSDAAKAKIAKWGAREIDKKNAYVDNIRDGIYKKIELMRNNTNNALGKGDSKYDASKHGAKSDYFTDGDGNFVNDETLRSIFLLGTNRGETDFKDWGEYYTELKKKGGLWFGENELTILAQLDDVSINVYQDQRGTVYKIPRDGTPGSLTVYLKHTIDEKTGRGIHFDCFNVPATAQQPTQHSRPGP